MSTGGVGGTPTTGGTGGTDPNCPEDPCQLELPQCGCADGEKCNWANDVSSCIPDGDKQPGDACSGNDCVAGSHCLTIGNPPLSVCKKYCADDSHCDAPGGLCVMQVVDAQMVPYEQNWCSDNCDPASGVGCNAANAKCTIGKEQAGLLRYFTVCVPAGTGGHQAPCSTFTDCASGYDCNGLDASQNQICLQWCNMASPNCSQGICTNFQTPVVVGTVTYGVCL